MNKNSVVLNERVSEVLYHFTTFDNALQIALKNAFMCTPSGINATDNKLGIKTLEPNGRLRYPYYFCCSRTRSSAVGYPAMRRNSLAAKVTSANKDWENMVRFEIDGGYINSAYRGNAVNYFNPNDSTLRPNQANWHKVNMNPVQHRLTQGTNDFVSEPYADRGITMGYFTVYHIDPKTAKLDLNRPLTDKTGKPITVRSESEFQRLLKRFNLNPNEYGIAPDGRQRLLNKALNEVLAERNLSTIPVKIEQDDETRQQLLRMASEYEDRIYSRERYIPHADRIVKRVDVLLPHIANFQDLQQEFKEGIQFLIHKFGKAVHLFNNSKDFDTQNDKNDLTKHITSNWNNADELYPMLKIKLGGGAGRANLFRNMTKSQIHALIKQRNPRMSDTEIDKLIEKSSWSDYKEKITRPSRLTPSLFSKICELMAYYTYAFPNVRERNRILNEYATKILGHDSSRQFNVNSMVEQCINVINTWEDNSRVDPRTNQPICFKPKTYSTYISSLKQAYLYDILDLVIDMKTICTHQLQNKYKTSVKIESINSNVWKQRHGYSASKQRMVSEARDKFYDLYHIIWG